MSRTSVFLCVIARSARKFLKIFNNSRLFLNLLAYSNSLNVGRKYWFAVGKLGLVIETYDTDGSSSKRAANSRAMVVFPVPTAPKQIANPRLAAIVHLTFSRAKLCVGDIYKYLGLGEVE